VVHVHILGHDAGEMAQLLAISLRLGAKKADFDATMALHPSAAEELVTLRNRRGMCAPGLNFPRARAMLLSRRSHASARLPFAARQV
jgi:hypothetical protein